MRVDPRELYAGLTGFCQPGVPAALHQSTWCSEMAIRFITEGRQGPWMLSVNPFDPHAPFDAPPEYLEKYDPETLPMPLFRDSDLERAAAFAAIDQQVKVPVDVRLRGRGAPEDRSRAEGGHDAVASQAPRDYDPLLVKAHYYAMIEQLDTQFGRILDTLRETGQLDNTLIVFCSDHGEMLGDHGLILKGARFFDGLVRVPLVMAWAGQFQEGLRSDALVELVDLAPTLLDAAGLEVPVAMQGRSLVPLLTGQADPQHFKDQVVCTYNDALDMPDSTNASMVCDGRHKIVVYHGHAIGELYDLQADPGEFDNLWDDPGSRDLKLTMMKTAFDTMMKTSDAGPPRVAKY
jgi:arylsulfatase A-like enzyme